MTELPKDMIGFEYHFWECFHLFSLGLLLLNNVIAEGFWPFKTLVVVVHCHKMDTKICTLTVVGVDCRRNLGKENIFSSYLTHIVFNKLYGTTVLAASSTSFWYVKLWYTSYCRVPKYDAFFSAQLLKRILALSLAAQGNLEIVCIYVKICIFLLKPYLTPHILYIFWKQQFWRIKYCLLPFFVLQDICAAIYQMQIVSKKYT